jgi:hypothetical protein
MILNNVKLLIHEIMKKIYFTLLILLVLTSLNIIAQTNGDYRTLFTTGGPYNWNTATNWQIYNGATWVTASSVPPASNEVITVLTGSNYTLNVSFSAEQLVIQSGGTLTISPAFTLTIATGAAKGLDVYGTIINSGTLKAVGTIYFESASTYQHNENGGTIPKATWATTSTCNINYTSGTITTAPLVASGQTFGNFTWNSNVPNTNLTFTGPSTVLGNFLVSLTGNTGVTGNTLHLEQTTLTVSGNFTTSGNSSVNLNVTTTPQTYNISGNFIIGGNYFFSNGTGLTTVNFIGSGNTINVTVPNFLDFLAGPNTASDVVFHITNGASYTLNSNMSIPAANTLTIDNGGTLYTGTDIINNNRNGETSSGGIFTVSSGGTLGIGSAQGISVPIVCGIGGSGNVQTCTTNFNTGANYIYDGTANQITGTGLTQNIPANITINNAGNTVSLSASTTLSGNIIISAGTFNANTYSITLGGNWTNSSTFTPSTGTVTFNGSSAQTIGGSSATTFSNLTINNSLGSSGGITLNVSPASATIITGALTLTNGKLITTSTNLLTMNAGSSATSGSASSFVDGPIAKTGTTAFVFPTGNVTTWAPIAIGVPSGSETFTAQYFHAGYGTYTISPTTPSSLNHVSSIEYWTLGRAGAKTAKVTLYSENAATSQITSCSDLRIAHWNGSAWENNNDAVTTTFGTCNVPISPTTQSGNIVTNAAVTSFSPFTFGSKTGTNPLPIKLLSFNAVCADSKVNLEWVTASETNNDYFTIEKSKDTRDWEFVLNMEGAGNSNSILYYNATDDKPLAGESYYRLKQTDFNGEFAYSNIDPVDCSSGQPFNFKSAYYSSESNEINLVFTASSGDSYKYSLLNLTGQLIQTKSGQASSGTNNIQINANGLSTGIYMVILQNNGKTFSRKVLVN